MEQRSAPIFREIHKNTWLKKRLPTSGDMRKLSVGPKKNDRFWVVFCVHDDCEALLEGYTEPRLAPFHNPEWTISLQHTMHVSHALVGMEQDFEFVITAPNEVFRFMAPSWDLMKEWVDTLRSKLREMKIISPRENVYSKLPETRLPLLPTRDPTSPLPLPPPEIPPAIVPGVEVPSPRPPPEPTPSTSTQSELNVTTASSTSHLIPPPSPSLSSISDSDSTDSTESSASYTPTSSHLPLSNTTSRSIMNLLSNPIQAYSAQNQQHQQLKQSSQDADQSSSSSTPKLSLAKIFTDNVLSPFSAKSPSEQKSRFDFNITPESLKFSTNIVASSSSQTNSPESVDAETATSVTVVSTPAQNILKIPRPQTSKSSNDNKKTAATTNNKQPTNDAQHDTGSTNITIIQLSNPSTSEPTDPSTESPQPEVHTTTTASSNNNEDSFNVQIIPSSNTSNIMQQDHMVTVVATDTNHQTTKVQVNASSTPLKSPSFSSVTNISVSGDNSVQEYESVFFSSQPTLGSAAKTVASQNLSRHHSLGSSDTPQSPHISTKVEIKTNTTAAPTTSTATVPSTSNHANSRISPRLLTRGMTEVSITRASRVDRNRNLRGIAPANSHAEMKAAVEKLKRESHDQRRRSSSASEAHPSRNNPSTAAVNNGNRHLSPTSRVLRHVGEHGSGQQQNMGRMTLREQQVMQLRTEMRHPGGVRLQLRRKDCLGSIAWVDAFGAVWIAGWKQKEHPMLYNALHIGDQLISIGSVTITTAAEANKIIRSVQTLFVELIIRRVPFGRVYAIRREVEGQCLGFIRDGNTATIVDIVPNSLAARHGLPPKANSCDGLSLSFWVLTEINGRPLNLFFKDNEVRDRLNAVGRDISILVQPSDLVAKLKKQLKSLRNHKDFIVQ